MDRREFLTLTAGAAASTLAVGAGVAPEPRRWRLAAEPGLFETSEIVSTADQLRFAAEHGIGAFVDAGWLTRSPVERAELTAAARELGVQWGPFRGPQFSCAVGDDWTTALEDAFAAALALHLSSIRVEFPTREWCPCGLIPNLGATAFERAAERSLTVLVEPLAREPSDYVRALQHHAESGAMLSVDLYTLAASGVDAVAWLDDFLSQIGHIELADFPGGLEPGTGRLDFLRIAATLDRHSYRGVVGLRHGRSQSGAEGVAAVLRSYVGVPALAGLQLTNRVKTG